MSSVLSFAPFATTPCGDHGVFCENARIGPGYLSRGAIRPSLTVSAPEPAKTTQISEHFREAQGDGGPASRRNPRGSGMPEAALIRSGQQPATHQLAISLLLRRRIAKHQNIAQDRRFRRYQDDLHQARTIIGIRNLPFSPAQPFPYAADILRPPTSAHIPEFDISRGSSSRLISSSTSANRVLDSSMVCLPSTHRSPRLTHYLSKDIFPHPLFHLTPVTGSALGIGCRTS